MSRGRRHPGLPPVESLPALHAEAVPAEVVVPAMGAHQPPRRIGLQPALVLAPVPHAVLGTEHPPVALAVEHGEIAHGQPERARLQAAVPALIHERPISDLRLGEGVHSHGLTVSPRSRTGRGGAPPRCKIHLDPGRRRPSMPRTTTRSSRSTSRGTRRTSPARGRSTRTRRTAPRLSNQQVREITAVLLILIGLIGLIAAASLSGSLLGGIRDWLFASFGRAWFVPVGLAVGGGAYLLWPNAPRPRPLDLVSGAVAVLALIGLFGMAGNAGGGLGGGIDQALIEVVSRPGAWVLLVAGLVIGLIVTLHFSPGAVIQAVVRGGQAAYAERRRLEALVAMPRTEPARNGPAKVAAKETAPIGR